MDAHKKINYLEIPARNIPASKAFFSAVFDWKFTDYGADYCAFSDAGMAGGLYQSELAASTETGSVLIVFYSRALEATQLEIEQAGGKIIKPVFAFPGGRRFHFSDPSANEFAVWSDQ
jgi:predicted enzyme related to lactoylglutathione lyase